MLRPFDAADYLLRRVECRTEREDEPLDLLGGGPEQPSTATTS